MIRLKRAYETPTRADGSRILVERLWPRGLSKERAALDLWLKEVAPSPELRKWYGHDPAKFGEFRQRYLGEFAGGRQRAALGRLRALASGGPLTLLTATRDLDHSQAAVLARLLQVEPADEGGEAACYAHLVCPECGAVVTEGHRPGYDAGDG